MTSVHQAAGCIIPPPGILFLFFFYAARLFLGDPPSGIAFREFRNSRHFVRKAKR